MQLSQNEAVRWAFTQYGTVLTKMKTLDAQRPRDVCAQKRACEATRKCPPENQGEWLHKKPNLPTTSTSILTPRTVSKCISVVQATQSIFYYVCPCKLTYSVNIH